MKLKMLFIFALYLLEGGTFLKLRLDFLLTNKIVVKSMGTEGLVESTAVHIAKASRLVRLS